MDVALANALKLLKEAGLDIKTVEAQAKKIKAKPTRTLEEMQEIKKEVEAFIKSEYEGLTLRDVWLTKSVDSKSKPTAKIEGREPAIYRVNGKLIQDVGHGPMKKELQGKDLSKLERVDRPSRSNDDDDMASNEHPGS